MKITIAAALLAAGAALTVGTAHADPTDDAALEDMATAAHQKLVAAGVPGDMSPPSVRVMANPAAGIPKQAPPWFPSQAQTSPPRRAARQNKDSLRTVRESI